jgi:ankyrin repeat protein
MKHLLITTIAAVVLVGCSRAEANRALFDAIHEESIQAVEQAITKNGRHTLADINARDESKRTPLLCAIEKNHKEIAELLIDKGADVNATNKKGFTPLDVAIGLEQPEIINLLRKHGGKTRKELRDARK